LGCSFSNLARGLYQRMAAPDIRAPPDHFADGERGKWHGNASLKHSARRPGAMESPEAGGQGGRTTPFPYQVSGALASGRLHLPIMSCGRKSTVSGR